VLQKQTTDYELVTLSINKKKKLQHDSNNHSLHRNRSFTKSKVL